MTSPESRPTIIDERDGRSPHVLPAHQASSIRLRLSGSTMRTLPTNCRCLPSARNIARGVLPENNPLGKGTAKAGSSCADHPRLVSGTAKAGSFCADHPPNPPLCKGGRVLAHAFLPPLQRGGSGGGPGLATHSEGESDGVDHATHPNGRTGGWSGVCNVSENRARPDGQVPPPAGSVRPSLISLHAVPSTVCRISRYKSDALLQK